MNKSIGMAAACLLAGLPLAAHAQTAATVRAIVRVVKAGRSGGSLESVRLGYGLGAGDRIRTGARSAAGLRFADASSIRVGELAELVVTSPRKRDARLLSGELIADYKAPGTISGGYAVAAVRGTEVHYVTDRRAKRDEVICYDGRVFVAAASNPIVAGSTAMVTGGTLTDPTLADNATDYAGGEVRFVDGPYAGQVRSITGFNAVTGAVSFGPLLTAGGGDGPSGFLLVKVPGARVVELTNNTGTTVREGAEPGDPYRVPHLRFARLERLPWYRELIDGKEVSVFPGGERHQREQEAEYPVREAVHRITDPLCDCHGQRLPPLRRAQLRGRGTMRSMLRQDLAHATQPGAPGGSRAPLTAEARALPLTVTETGQFDRARLVQFRFEPFAIGSSDADAAGARVRVQASDGDVYAELGYRYGRFGHKLFDGADDDHDVSEGFIHARGRLGDLVIGRQHLFLGPANNNDIGTLLGLEATDAAIYELPLRRGFKQQVGYVWDSRSLQEGGTRGAHARGQAPLWRGNAGYSLRHVEGSGRQIGWTVDAAQAVVRNTLDVYAEGGRDSRGRTLTTAGLYFPCLFQKWRVDTFVEYARRESRDERVSLRLRKELGSGLLAVLFVDNRLGGRLTGGGGVLWSARFR